MDWKNQKVAVDRARFVVLANNYDREGRYTSGGLQAAFRERRPAEECCGHFARLAQRHGAPDPELMTASQFWGRD